MESLCISGACSFPAPAYRPVSPVPVLGARLLNWLAAPERELLVLGIYLVGSKVRSPSTALTTDSLQTKDAALRCTKGKVRRNAPEGAPLKKRHIKTLYKGLPSPDRVGTSSEGGYKQETL